MAARRKSGLSTIFIKDVDRVISLNVPNTDNLLLVENLSPLITNERLCSAFTSFGSIKFGYIIVDENHDSTGFGLISFNSKDTAIIATKRCEDLKFVITRLPTGVKVTNLKLSDDSVYIGLPQMLVNQTSQEYEQEMTSTPRFITERNQKEHDHSIMWRNLIKSEERDFIALKLKYTNMKKELRKRIQQSMIDDQRNILRNRIRNLNRSSMLTNDEITHPIILEDQLLLEENTEHLSSETSSEQVQANQEAPQMGSEQAQANQEAPQMEEVVVTSSAVKEDSFTSGEYY